ncbi:type IV pilus assembly protein PilM [candidate division NPL-UPA2 bacterium]|nr:type IV pilus assembly protein PilM [candidate division NPL-UPA2 bacterium]
MAILERRAIGLDIGTATVKLVELTSSRGGLRLIDFSCKEIEKREGEEEKEAISRTIRELFEEKKIKEERIISALPLSSVVVRNITFPFKEAEKIEKTIKFEAESYLPFPVEEAIIDFHITDESKGKETEVLMVAVDKRRVREHLEVLHLAAVEPVVTALDVSAIFNTYCLGAAQEETGATAIIDMGAEKTSVVVVSDGALSFTRAIAQGGRNLTRILAEEQGISFEEAEELKKERGLTASGESQPGAVIKRALEPLLKEMERTFISFQARSGKEVEEIVLTGGASQLPGLTEHLSDELGVGVSLYHLAKGVEHRLNPTSLSLICVGMGLALGGLGRGKLNFNFRKEEFSLRLDWARMRRHLILPAILAGGIVCLGIFGLLMDLHLKEKRYQTLNEKISTVLKETFPHVRVVRGMELELVRRELEEEKKGWQVFKELTPRRPSPLEIMRELYLRIPEEGEVQLSDLRLTRDAVKIRGKAASFRAVNLLRQELEKSPHFKRVSLGRARASSDGKEVEFTLNIYFKGD